MTGLEKCKCAFHPERPSTGKAASSPPLPARFSTPVMRNQSKCERSPGQRCRQSHFSLLETLRRQPAGRAPSCLPARGRGAGWLEMWVFVLGTWETPMPPAEPRQTPGDDFSLYKAQRLYFHLWWTPTLSTAPWAGAGLHFGFRTSFIFAWKW